MTIPNRGGRRRLNPPPTKRKIRTPWWQTALGLLLLGAAAYSAGSTYTIGAENQERADCQARVNTQVVAALKVRDDANRRTTQAQRTLIEARLAGRSPGVTPRQADQGYLRALDELQRVRDANPIEGAQTC